MELSLGSGSYDKTKTTDNPDKESLAINFDYDTLDDGLGLRLQVIANDGVTVLAEIKR